MTYESGNGGRITASLSPGNWIGLLALSATLVASLVSVNVRLALVESKVTEVRDTQRDNQLQIERRIHTLERKG